MRIDRSNTCAAGEEGAVAGVADAGEDEILRIHVEVARGGLHLELGAVEDLGGGAGGAEGGGVLDVQDALVDRGAAVVGVAGRQVQRSLAFLGEAERRGAVGDRTGAEEGERT